MRCRTASWPWPRWTRTLDHVRGSPVGRVILEYGDHQYPYSRQAFHAIELAGQLLGPVEVRGAEVAGTRIQSVRLPSLVVTTEVVFGGPGERLIMRHDPGLTPAPYVLGTLLAVRKVTDVVGVRRGLDSLLFG
jgi:hypothetical protein